LAIATAAVGLVQATEEQLPTLKVANQTYSKVIITSVTATDIYFTHSRGMGNAKLKDLEPNLQAQFHFDPAKAAASQTEQMQANALYATAALGTQPPKSQSNAPGLQQPAPNRHGVEGDIGVSNSSDRSGRYYLPPGYEQKEVPLVVLMHGTGGSGADILGAFRGLAAQRGFAIVAPDSRQAPNGMLTWEVSDRPDKISEDLTHTMNCVQALKSMPGVRVDSQRTLIAGFSAGGSSAPYIASNEPFFRAFAVLHGGIIPGGFAANRVRGWFSTGDSDPARPGDDVRRAMEQLKENGWTSNLEFKTFPGGHQLSVTELRAVIEWWLSD
jgi:phospholipase/carboxylesterase